MSISRLPSEIIYQILVHLPSQTVATQAQLIQLTSTARIFYFPATSLLLNQPLFNSLSSLDAFIDSLETDEKRVRCLSASVELEEEEIYFENEFDQKLRSSRVQTIVVKCNEFLVRGWGVRVGKIMRNCRFLRGIKLIGIEDLRIKQIIGSGCLRHLTLQGVTFRAHSLAFSPSLDLALSNLTHLTLDNIGLPSPISHLYSLLSSAKRLKHLEISSLRDITPELLMNGLSVVYHRLISLKIGHLTDSQAKVFPDLLKEFKILRKLQLTLPLTLEQLEAIGSSVQVLSIQKSKGSNQNVLIEEAVKGIVEGLSNRRCAVGLKKLILFPVRGLRKIEDLCQEREIEIIFTNYS